MTQTDEPPLKDATRPAPPPILFRLRTQLRPLLVGFSLLTLLTGILFPLVLTALAWPIFPHQAGGSLLTRDSTGVVGSELIGQPFSRDRYFHPRPSVAGDGYDAANSNGSNLAPSHAQLHADVAERVAAYRRDNLLPPDAVVPIDAVTSSASGLDPHISPANAELQVKRVAEKSGLTEDAVRRLVAEHTRGRQLGFLGEPRVNVLTLNLAIDRATASSAR